MITINDLLTNFQTIKARFNELFTLVNDEVNADATLAGLTSNSKTSEYGKWMYVFTAMGVIMDSVWADRQQQITDKIESGLPGTDPWMQKELMKFQYGDTLLWTDKGGYYYAVIDASKQIIARCAVVSSGGITNIKVAKLSGLNPIPLTAPELAAFNSYKNQIQWSGSKLNNPVSYNSDKLDAPMTVYYNGTRKLDEIKAIVEGAWVEYLSKLPFNGEYSINKHADYVEGKTTDIKEVNPGTVRARADAGSFVNVNRVYNPASGYLERDPAISFSTMITYVPL